jgi:hypothetical protein
MLSSNQRSVCRIMFWSAVVHNHSLWLDPCGLSGLTLLRVGAAAQVEAGC